MCYFREEVTGRQGGQIEHSTAEPTAGGKTSLEKKQLQQLKTKWHEEIKVLGER